MKKLILSLFIISFIGGCKAQSENQVNVKIVDILKKDKFNMEVFELSFCIEELLYIVENDSSFFRMWADKIDNSFANTIKDEVLYIHSIEYNLFKMRLNEESDLKNKYPIAFKRIKNYEQNITPKYYENFSNPFKVYIEYPEQLDDICLIMLLSNIDCVFFEDIQNDKVAFWKFNNWIEYGFEEFRYYPGTLNKGKGIINNRIIEHVLESDKCQYNSLVKNSIIMIKKIKEKY